MHDAERGIGVLQARGDDAKRQVVVELRDVDPLAVELLVDRVEALHTEADFGLDAGFAEVVLEPRPDRLRGVLTELELLLDLRLEGRELVRVEVEEGQILEVALHPRHPQAMGDGSVENYHHPSSEGTFRVPAPETTPNSPVD